MAYTLQQSINWAQAFTEGVPITAYTASEPAISIATMVRNTIMGAPFIWGWNRNEDSSTSTVVGTQDYTINLTDFGFLEKVTLVDGSGNAYEMKDVFNTNVLGKGNPNNQSRPNSICVKNVIYGTSVTLRFLGVPDAIYTIYVTYQQLPIDFAQFTVTAAGNASAGNTTYTGTFVASAFVTGQQASIAGFVTHVANSGTFQIVSCNATTLVLANPNGVAETNPAFAINQSWFPVPDTLMQVFNNLFLGEAFQYFDDARGQQYRQRGVMSLLAKAEGLSEMDRNIFLEQFLARGSQATAAAIKTTQGAQARGV